MTRRRTFQLFPSPLLLTPQAVAERVAGGSIGLGRLLVAVALVLLLLWVAWR
jgi:hypothetical protein